MKTRLRLTLRALSCFNQRACRGLFISVFLAFIYCLLNSDTLSRYLFPQLANQSCDLPQSILETDESPTLLSWNEAEELCSRYDLPVYPPRSHRRKVYDLVLVNTELEWLEIRLNELESEVDYFIILESTESFTGIEKPLFFKQNYHYFSKFAHKIIYHALNISNFDGGAWGREHYTRDALFTSVFPHLLPPAAPQEYDVLLVSDIDEIPRPSTIKVLRTCDFPQRTTLRSRFYYYSFQWQHVGDEWHHPQATYFTNFTDTIRPEDLRMGGGWDFPNASWHCSSCFKTIAELVTKIESFSHQEYNTEESKEPSEIVRRVRNGVDLFERESELYEKIEAEDVPSYLNENRDRFMWMLDRDPENANFEDFEL
jgi:beta-1,4-mannosyl-glycoprotein beta-1,4-N-acetylglucosaminyltransferase